MAEIKIAAIMRAGAYSPNHIGNDAAILNAAAEQLRKRGCLVNIYSEEQFNTQGVEENVILNMCREQKSIENLQKAEDAGKIVINSGFGIENCTRERMTRILLGNGIPYPESLIVNTDEAIKPMLKKSGFQSCWIKRGDFHAMHKEDVSFVRHPEEAQGVLQEYFLRGIKREDIERGQVLCKPGSVTPHTKFTGEIYVLTKEEGGRHTPFFDGYRPQFYFRTTDVTGIITLPEGTEMCMPGDNVDMHVELITPVAMEEGMRFAIREGGHTVGSGVVSKIEK